MRYNKSSETTAGLAADPAEIAAGKIAAQIGFYREAKAPLSDFEVLLYRGHDSGAGPMLADLRTFFSTYNSHISPKPGTTAARLVWFLLHERRYRNVDVHQGLKADIGYFYKISFDGESSTPRSSASRRASRCPASTAPL